MIRGCFGGGIGRTGIIGGIFIKLGFTSKRNGTKNLIGGNMMKTFLIFFGCI